MDTTTFIYGFLAVGFLLFLFLRLANSDKPNLDHIPTYGPSGPLTSYFGAIRFIRHAEQVVREGCQKYPGAIFKVPAMDRWLVIVSSPSHIQEISKSPDDRLSTVAALQENLQATYTLGGREKARAYEVNVIRSALTRNFGDLFSDTRDEIVAAFDDVLALNGNGWKKIPALDAMTRVVCRVSNRLFVGLPLCRNPEYQDLNMQFTIDVVTAAQKINLFPNLVKPIVGPLFSKLKANRKLGMKHLGAIFTNRLKKAEEYGKDWPGKPNDLISWLIDEAKGPEERTPENLTLRVLAVNFASIFTTSMTFTYAIFRLAAHPEYAQAMREEVESIVRQDGWTKAAIGQMRKVDSFLRETQRLNMLSILGMNRRARNSFTFSDGTVIPPNAFVSVAANYTHRSEDNYSNPNEFNGFRFSDIIEEDGEGPKHQMVTLGTNHIPFGNGRHACPGRFFAANELKAMLGHVLVSFDVKFENDGERPASVQFGPSSFPNRSAKVMFKKRQI